MRTDTARQLEEAARIHQEKMNAWDKAKKGYLGRLDAFREEFKGVSPLYESHLSQSFVAGLRDGYRRVFEEGYFGRTIHDVTSYYNNDPDKQRGGDDEKQNDKKAAAGYNRDDDTGMSM